MKKRKLFWSILGLSASIVVPVSITSAFFVQQPMVAKNNQQKQQLINCSLMTNTQLNQYCTINKSINGTTLTIAVTMLKTNWFPVVIYNNQMIQPVQNGALSTNPTITYVINLQENNQTVYFVLETMLNNTAKQIGYVVI